MALSKANVKLLRSLQQKKFRQKYNKFVVEGEKMVAELLDQAPEQIVTIYGLSGWIEKNLHHFSPESVVEVTPPELNKISGLSTPNQVLALVRIPKPVVKEAIVAGGYSLYLDGIRDPGNLGTILRIADWFGLPYVFVSPDCVDGYNPKVVQASMGAFIRVGCVEYSLPDLLEAFPNLPVLGAVLDGENVFKMTLPEKGLVVIGSEARGISPEVVSRLSHRISIPAAGNAGAESLNAAVATGIICAVLRNR